MIKGKRKNSALLLHAGFAESRAQRAFPLVAPGNKKEVSRVVFLDRGVFYFRKSIYRQQVFAQALGTLFLIFNLSSDL